MSASNPIADPDCATKREGEKMPEETNLENQTQAGENPVTEATDDQNAGSEVAKTGGPSEEWKLKRLEQERNEAIEKLKRLEEAKKAEENSNKSEDEIFTEEQEVFYRDKAVENINKELSSEIEKLPKALQERIKADPFNPAWTDEKTLEFELYGVDSDNPKERFEATQRAALKSIPEFVAGFAEGQPQVKEVSNFGTNPPTGQTNPMTGNKDLWQMTDDELIALKKAREGSVI